MPARPKTSEWTTPPELARLLAGLDDPLDVQRLARATGIDRRSLLEWFTGKRAPRYLDSVQRLAFVLRVDVAELERIFERARNEKEQR